MSSRIGLVGLALASAIVGGAASSYVAIAVAQTQPVTAPAPARARFEHWCQVLDGSGLRTAGERGWEMVTAYSDFTRAKIHFVGATGSWNSQFHAAVPDLPTRYCFKRPMR